MVSDNDFLDLQDRFNALKLTVDTLLTNGLNSMLMVPGTLRFGTNEMQVGHYGIQVLSHAAGKTAFFFFDDDFQPNPNTPTNPSTTPYAAVIGGADRLNASPYSTLSLDSFAATATSELSVISRDAANDHAKTQSYVNVGANIGTVAHDMDGGRSFAQLILSNTVLEVASFSSDPGTLNNGDIWYNSTGNVFKVRANGATVTLGGGVATDAIWDAKGDLAVGTGADTASKLAVGSDGQVLFADSSTATGLKWQHVLGGGLNLNGGSQALDFSKGYIRAAALSSNQTITLPQFTGAAAELGKMITVKRSDVSNYTVGVAPYSGQTIDGSSATRYLGPYDSLTFLSPPTAFGTDWGIA